MNEIARLPDAERRTYFEQAAARWGRLPAQLIEKDFWVCWLLRRVFALELFGPHLTFKGGTSLSKAYQAIDRFSEDVDVAIERSHLGFGDDQEPERGGSGKERRRRVEALQAACQRTIAEQLRPALEAVVAAELPHRNWRLELADDDPDRQSIRFHFPASLLTGLNRYFAPSVKLEMGARSDHFPVELRPVRPYLADAFPDLVADPVLWVRVLHIERTFWEKATILHMLAHYPDGKPFAKSMSRHFYDLCKVADHPDCASAIQRQDLRDRVAIHKSIFFASAQARYDEVRRGQLRLLPAVSRRAELRKDYRDMQPMFFGPVPVFEDLLDQLTELEREINRR